MNLLDAISRSTPAAGANGTVTTIGAAGKGEANRRIARPRLPRASIATQSALAEAGELGTHATFYGLIQFAVARAASRTALDMSPPREEVSGLAACSPAMIKTEPPAVQTYGH
jgi:hypothetical protein